MGATAAAAVVVLLELELELDEATEAAWLMRDWIDSEATDSRCEGSSAVARGECGSGAMGLYVVAGAERVVIRSSSESEAADEADDMIFCVVRDRRGR